MVRKVDFSSWRIHDLNISLKNNLYSATNSYPPTKESNPGKNNFLSEFSINKIQAGKVKDMTIKEIPKIT